VGGLPECTIAKVARDRLVVSSHMCFAIGGCGLLLSGMSYGGWVSDVS
jgi:hypothetical protein